MKRLNGGDVVEINQKELTLKGIYSTQENISK